jgi:hypothetical protein
MIIAIDFDGTLVDDDREYNDLSSPLKLLPGARAALYAMRKAGHTLVLVSARANRALRIDWRLNPLWRNGTTPFSQERWEKSRDLNQRRYDQMLAFVDATLRDVFACVDDGAQGKVSADVYIDDRALRYGEYATWSDIQRSYGA